MIGHLDPIDKARTLALVDDRLDTYHAWVMLDFTQKDSSLTPIHGFVDNACDKHDERIWNEILALSLF